MCGRFTLRSNWAQIAQVFQLERWEEHRPRYNIAPESTIFAVRRNPASGSNELVPLRWGLIPSWSKDPTIARKLINARGETVAEKPSFRSAFRARRCLIVADGFYEWKQEPRRKQPVYIRLKDDGPFGFAGLWESWKHPEGELETCTIITTEANDLLRPVHDRMPVIIPADHHEEWLDPSRRPGTELLVPYPSAEMTYFPVSTLVNRATQDLPECILPLADT